MGYNPVPLCSINFTTRIDIKNLYNKSKLHRYYYYTFIVPISFMFFGGKVVSESC